MSSIRIALILAINLGVVAVCAIWFLDVYPEINWEPIAAGLVPIAGILDAFAIASMWRRRGTSPEPPPDDGQRMRTSTGSSRGEPELHNSSMVFVSGSKPSGAPQRELDRFTAVAQAVGGMLGDLNMGIVGCPAHPSRVLASVEAMKGLVARNPDSPTYYANVSFPLSASKRQRFIDVAGAAIFIGGGAGTREEFDLCLKIGLLPLIPVAGAGGTGQRLSQDLSNNQVRYFSRPVQLDDVRILADPDLDVEVYINALHNILVAHQISGVGVDWNDFQNDPTGRHVAQHAPVIEIPAKGRVAARYLIPGGLYGRDD